MSLVMDLLWAQASKTLYLTREAWERSMLGWAIEEVRVGEDLGGAILRKDDELHFAVFDTGHRASRQILIDAVRPQLEKYGHVLTKTPKDDTRQARFNQLVGFKAVGTDAYDYTLFRLDAADFRYREKLACPQ